MRDYLTGTKQTLRNVINIQGRSQDFPSEGGGGNDCLFRGMFTSSRHTETYVPVIVILR